MPSQDSLKQRIRNMGVTVLLVQLGRNMYAVFETVSHVKTMLSPAPNWRGNCGTQY